MRVNQAIRDGSLFENEALVGAFERARARGGDVHLLGLVSHGGVHSHIDHLRALLELARRAGDGGATWIHAFTDGRDVSPTSAVSTISPSCRPSGSRPWSAATTRWTATSAGSGRRRRSTRSRWGGVHLRHPAKSSTEVQRSYDAGVTDEFLEPIVVEGAPRLGARATRRSSSTSGPTAAGSSREARRGAAST